MKLSNHTARTPGTPRCSLHRSLMLCTAKFWGGNAAAPPATRQQQLHCTREPGPRRRRRRTRWRQNSPARRGVHGGGAAASFYFCLRPVPEATVGCRPPTPTDVRCSAAPNTNFFLHSNFVKQCGEQLNDGKLEIRIS